jgi:NAD(P)-dependent dehydrogenase (short-subunit alcohol dehydrogenase family)
MGQLDGKVAVITGASRGLGLAIAHAFAAEGAAVVIGSRSEDALTSAAEVLMQEEARVGYQAVDVRDRSQIQELAKLALESFGQLDIWVNNAAVAGAYGPTVHVPQDDFMQTLHTNIHGVYFGSIIAMEHFLSMGRGKLINILGRGARGPAPFQNAYGSTKAWIRNFTLALASEYKYPGIDIFAFNPGLMDTDLLRRIDIIQGFEHRLKPFKTVIRMWASPPEHAAEKAVWMASSQSDGRSGLEVRLSGPLTLFRGTLQDVWARLLRKPKPPITLALNSIQPAIQYPSSTVDGDE